jgi:hypothetical protein
VLPAVLLQLLVLMSADDCATAPGEPSSASRTTKVTIAPVVCVFVSKDLPDGVARLTKVHESKRRLHAPTQYNRCELQNSIHAQFFVIEARARVLLPTHSVQLADSAVRAWSFNTCTSHNGKFCTRSFLTFNYGCS